MMSACKTILVIDDEKGFREFYKYLLEPLGYTVDTASDGEEGLKKALANDYDLIFLDVHMPKMQGPEVMEEIKRVKPAQVVVILSSSSDPLHVFEQQARNLGALECLYKPVELEEVLEIMKRAFGAKHHG